MNILNQTRATTISEAHKINRRAVLRLTMPLLVLLFCAAFNWSYVEWLSPVWGYLGIVYKSPDPLLLMLGYVLALALCVFSPLRIQRPSQVIYWLLYFTVYIPGLFVPLFMQLDSGFTLFLIQMSLASGMLVIALSYRLKLLNVPRYPIRPSLFWAMFFFAFLVCNVILLVIYRGNLHFASLKEVYTVRAEAAKIGTKSFGIAYVSGALSSVMNPFLIAYGLSVRRRKVIALGFLGQILVYTTAAMKSVLMSPVLIIVFYYSLKRDRGGWAPKLALLFTSLFCILTTLAIGKQEGIFFNLASATLLRSFAMPGLFIAQYQYFFETFPHTYLGHVNGISLMLPTAYSLPMGKEVSSFFLGGGDKNGYMDANACFFAFDGIAGFGLPGIPLMGALCAAMFSILDSCGRKYSIAFPASALTMCTISLTNGSLFTTFLSGGVMAFMLLFIFMPRYLLDAP